MASDDPCGPKDSRPDLAGVVKVKRIPFGGTDLPVAGDLRTVRHVALLLRGNSGPRHT